MISVKSILILVLFCGIGWAEDGQITSNIVDVARHLYEGGQYSGAQDLLQQALKTNPNNRSAAYYLDLVRDAKTAEAARTNFAAHKIPNALSHAIYGRKEILNAITRMIIPNVNYNSLLPDVLGQLQAESQRSGAGINFMLQPYAGVAEEVGRPIADMESVRIKITPGLLNVRFSEALDAIVKGANAPIRYEVEDFGIVFLPRAAHTNALQTRVYHVDTNIFCPSLQALCTNATETLGTALRYYLGDAGVDVNDKNTVVFFNPAKGQVYVRVAEKQLPTVDQAIRLINEPQQPELK